MTLTSGQLTGLIIGLVLFAIVAVVLAVILTRRKYVGSFGNKAGAVKFQEEVTRMNLNPFMTNGHIIIIWERPLSF